MNMLLAADLANIDRMITHNERLLGLARECGFLDLADALSRDLSTIMEWREKIAAAGALWQ
jgi:hypothetical protein